MVEDLEDDERANRTGPSEDDRVPEDRSMNKEHLSENTAGGLNAVGPEKNPGQQDQVESQEEPAGSEETNLLTADVAWEPVASRQAHRSLGD